MKKYILAILALPFLIAVLSGCKKEDGTDTKIDDIVGNYLVNDTAASLSGCNGGPAGDVDYDSYGIVVTKKNDNTVTISSFNHCGASFDASVSATGVIALESEPCASVSNVVGSISGNKIYFTYKLNTTICEFNVRGTAIKQ